MEAWYLGHRTRLAGQADAHLLLPTFSRLDTTARKLAALFEIASNEARPVVVSYECAADALHYVDFLFERMRPRLVEGGLHSEQDKKVTKALTWVRREPGIGRSRLMQKTGIRAYELDDITQALVEDDRLVTEKNEGGGVAQYPAEGA